MEFRNAKYNTDGTTIDCEVNHPEFGWIPFTASPTDPNAAGVQLYNDIIADGNIAAADPIDLNDVKAAARYDIDFAAEMARLRYITNGAGQSLTYRTKAEEARAYKAAGYPVDATNYPFVATEAAATSQTPTEVADAIIAQEDAWIVIGASIEGNRMGGKKSVNEAADATAVETARSSTVAALDAI